MKVYCLPVLLQQRRVIVSSIADVGGVQCADQQMHTGGRIEIIPSVLDRVLFPNSIPRYVMRFAGTSCEVIIETKKGIYEYGSKAVRVTGNLLASFVYRHMGRPRCNGGYVNQIIHSVKSE